jgi:hypothetical protein
MPHAVDVGALSRGFVGGSYGSAETIQLVETSLDASAPLSQILESEPFRFGHVAVVESDERLGECLERLVLQRGSLDGAIGDVSCFGTIGTRMDFLEGRPYRRLELLERCDVASGRIGGVVELLGRTLRFCVELPVEPALQTFAL